MTKADIKEKAVYTTPACECIQAQAQQMIATSGNTEGFDKGEFPFGILPF